MDLDDTWRSCEMLAPTFQVEVVGTTGAGDCAIAGFFAALLHGRDPADSLISAVAAGACNVEVADAISGIPTWAGLQARIDQDWDKHTLDLSLAGWQWDATPGLWRGPHDVLPTAA